MGKEAYPEKEPEFSTHIAGIGVDHVRDRDSHNNAKQCLDSCRNSDGFRADLSCRSFAYNDEAHGTNGEPVDEIPDEHQ